MKICLGKNLSRLRTSKSLSQTDVAEKLKSYGISVSHRAVHTWEKEISQPNATQLIALCDIYDVDDLFWEFCGEHRGLYTALNEEGREKAREFINMIFLIDKYRDDPKEDNVSFIPTQYKLYSVPVSAGHGNFLDDSDYEIIEAPAYVPSSADFALRVTGDSMKPLIQHEQIIWIHETPDIKHGEIGVFHYDSDVLVKKLIIDNDKIILRSLNSDYEDKEIKEDMGFKAYGKVVA